MAWWYLELTAADADAGQPSSCNVARAQRLVLALAFGCFDEGVALKKREGLDVLGPSRVSNVACCKSLRAHLWRSTLARDGAVI
jgi:hypothetical protein